MNKGCLEIKGFGNGVDLGVFHPWEVVGWKRYLLVAGVVPIGSSIGFFIVPTSVVP